MTLNETDANLNGKLPKNSDYANFRLNMNVVRSRQPNVTTYADGYE